MRFGRPGWIASIVGTLAYGLAWSVLPWALAKAGMAPRAATGEVIKVAVFVGPIGLLTSGMLGLLGQSLKVPGWTAAPLLVGIPAIVSGLGFGALAEGIVWARTRSRALFLGLVLCPLLYWAGLIALYLFA